MPVVDKKSLEMSPAAFPMLEVINISLHSLQELLAKPLFTKVWQQIASELNLYLYEEVGVELLCSNIIIIIFEI